jgi:hypothetical protein
MVEIILQKAAQALASACRVNPYASGRRLAKEARAWPECLRLGGGKLGLFGRMAKSRVANG